MSPPSVRIAVVDIIVIANLAQDGSGARHRFRNNAIRVLEQSVEITGESLCLSHLAQRSVHETYLPGMPCEAE